MELGGSEVTQGAFIKLYESNLIPLNVVLVALTWGLYDYFLTLPDEIRYIWPQRRSFGKFLFLWIRYYTICLLLFDTVQIHVFARPDVPTDDLCVMIAPVARILGAISLWSVEFIMQLRIYALFNRSRKIAVVNVLVFFASIALFLWILVINATRRRQMIVFAAHLPLPGCPVVNGGTEWALWIAPMVYEFILFSMVIYKAFVSISARVRLNERITLTKVLIQENIWYFFCIGFLLLFNNLMVIGATKIPWFGLGPFHAAIGIATSRMLLHLRKFSEHKLANNYQITNSTSSCKPLSALESLRFASPSPRVGLAQCHRWLEMSGSTTIPTEEGIYA